MSNNNIEDNKRSFNDAGFEIKESAISGPLQLGAMSANPDMDVLNREGNDRSAQDAYYKLQEIGELDFNDLYEEAQKMIRNNDPILNGKNILAGIATPKPIQQRITSAPQQQSQYFLHESQVLAAHRGESWEVVEKAAKTTSGSRISIFMVEDSVSGMSTGKKYRVKEVADKVARVVNATGNIDDPRIATINEQYDKHVVLMKKINEAKSSRDSSNLSLLENQLRVVNMKLGI